MNKMLNFTIDMIFLLSFIVLLISFIFDLTVTYTVYKAVPEHFFKYEANEGFKETLAQNKSILYDHTVQSRITQLCIYFIVYISTRRWKNHALISTFLFMTSLNLTAAGLHLSGGMSWIR